MTTTFRNAIFQLHWFFGITAGIVLALVGVTGGVLSFEDEILKALNPGVMTVEPRGRALAPSVLVERVGEQRPGEAITSLELSADPRDAAMVGFAPKEGERRGERRHVDPYTGQVLPEPRHQGFFRTTMQLHRWLVADDIGKQIVGASTVILVFFCISGIYLRWPRRWGSLRTWFALDWRQKGRNFLWHLHSIVGTWVLVTYLVMSLTGLWWSYGWYRDAVNRWAEGGAPAKAEVVEVDAGDRGTPPALDVDAAWQAFTAAAPAWSSATLGWPKGDGPLEFRYLDADPAHERARNTLSLDRWTLAPTGHERYDDRSWRRKIGGSMFALHRGSFFGTGGVVVFMLTSLLMPLFAITGWMLYLDRRRGKRTARQLAREAQALPALAPPAGGAPVLVAHASQTGTAEGLAWKTAAMLRDAGCAAEVHALGTLTPERLAAYGQALFVVSTFGDGEAPDPARAFARRLRANAPALGGLRYGVLALGDREYGEHFCGFGRVLDQQLHHAGAQPLFDRVEVDAGDAAALRHWQHHLGQLTGHTGAPDWRAPEYREWRLAERRLLNPGSAGGPAFHLALVPKITDELRWQAGDIAEIGPRHAPADVAAWLATVGLDGSETVTADGTQQPLQAMLARSQLPDPMPARWQSAQAVADVLKPLPHREYSIASLPSDGSLQLLVRRMNRPDGRPGSGSGWLTSVAEVGDSIDLRIRSNPSFHPPADARPLLLIGNGTGLAGLRAVLKARIAAGHDRNWLLFGERSAAHDGFHGEELAAWHHDGHLRRLDLVFSRDQPERRYVQHVLAEAADEVRRWVDAGAAVYVCGSLEGMAPGVDAVLADIVGRDALEAMAADGRYRRDVY
jgi:sulfite reductase (NADPH) flavoprotein alpha-component